MEVYLQRLVYLPEGQGLARPESALFEHTSQQEEEILQRAEAVARELGVMFSASGATSPRSA